MDGSKKSSVTSSMIDLKAELFRKKEEFKRQKAAGSSFVKGPKTEKSTKGGIWSRQNAGVLARAGKDVQDDAKDGYAEDDDALAKSKRALQEKAKLYDKLCNSSTIPEEDGSDYYLVDFQKKVIDSIVEDREASRRREEEEEEEAEKRALSVEIPEPTDPDEEWIDFKDSFGRDRRCMKKDLDQLMEQDRKLALVQCQKRPDSGAVEGTDQLPSLMSSDMYRETMRQKWENEMKELQEKGQEEIHYSNVQFDEIRTHGVGFFQFSKDHETREEQLEDLKKMREKTLDEHARKDRIKEKRKVMMEARLAKVRQRRNLKEVPAEVKPESDHDNEAVGPKLSEELLPPSTEDIIKKEEMEKQAEEKRKAHVREWDKEKPKVIPQRKNYIETLRQEREQEFAPPSAYFKEPTSRLNRASEDCSVKTPQSLFKTASSDRRQSPLASGSILEDKVPESSTADGCKDTYNSIETRQSETAAMLTAEGPSSTPQDHAQVIGTANTWPQHDYHHHDQPSQVTHYGLGQPQLGTSSFPQKDEYQHLNMQQGQNQHFHMQQGQNQHLNMPQGQHQQLNLQQGQQQNFNMPQGQQQHFNMPQQGQNQHFNMPQQGQNQHFNMPQQGQNQHFNMPQQGQNQHFNMPQQGQNQHFNMPQQGQNQHFNMPQQGQQQPFNMPQGQNQHFNMPQGQQQPFNMPQQGQHQHFNFSQGQYQNFNMLQGQQQHFNMPQGQHQHFNMPQGQQSYPQQRSSILDQPHQHSYLDGANNQQIPGEACVSNSLIINSGVLHLTSTSSPAVTEATPQPTATSEPIKADTDTVASGPKRPKIQKMAIMDMRNFKNEEIPPVDMCSANSTALTAVPYTPGSFTAAKHLTVQQYEESVSESSLKNQISGTAVRYTAQQMKNQELEHAAKENNQDATDPAADQMIQDFLSSIRSDSNS